MENGAVWITSNRQAELVDNWQHTKYLVIKRMDEICEQSAVDFYNHDKFYALRDDFASQTVQEVEDSLELERQENINLPMAQFITLDRLNCNMESEEIVSKINAL